ncbi:hypothetical protein [Streptomyces fumanus]|uniref:hypothetical protein n=1 Tax=Streptomyces fumanus TaxID=67302 RepID=UPI0033CA6868
MSFQSLDELAAKLDSYVCLLPGCTEEGHSYDTCTVELPDVDFDGGEDAPALYSELVAEATDRWIHATVFNGLLPDGPQRTMRNRAEAAAFTAQLRRLADAIDTAAAALLPPGGSS